MGTHDGADAGWGRETLRWAKGVLALVVVQGFLGCQGPAGNDPTTVAGKPSGPFAGAARVGAAATSSPVVEDLAARALRSLEDKAATDQAFLEAKGREGALFSALLNRAMHESRDVGPVLVRAGVLAVGDGDGARLSQAIAEVSHRECCLRRSFQASALEGIRQAVEASDSVPAFDRATRNRLERFAADPDADLSGTATRLLGLGGPQPVP